MPANARVLILSPHCDDAPLSVGAALLSGQLGSGVHVSIVFSRSRFTKDHPCNGPELEITRIRHREERLAARAAGYTVDFWGFGEPFARPGFQDTSVICDGILPVQDQEVWVPVSHAIDEAISRHEGLVVAPLGCGGHVDHRLVREAFLLSCQKYPRVTPAFFEDLPYCDWLTDEEILSLLPKLPHAGLRPRIVNQKLQEKLALV